MSKAKVNVAGEWADFKANSPQKQSSAPRSLLSSEYQGLDSQNPSNPNQSHHVRDRHETSRLNSTSTNSTNGNTRQPENRAAAKPSPANIWPSTVRANPGGDPFAGRIGALYGIAFTIKMTRKFAGQRIMSSTNSKANGDGIPAPRPLEAQKARWRWKLIIRTPDFVTEADLQSSGGGPVETEQAARRKRVRLETLDEGRCVQMLHVGPYEMESESMAANEGLRQEKHCHFARITKSTSPTCAACRRRKTQDHPYGSRSSPSGSSRLTVPDDPCRPLYRVPPGSLRSKAAFPMLSPRFPHAFPMLSPRIQHAIPPQSTRLSTRIQYALG